MVDAMLAVAEMALLHRQRDALPPPPPAAPPPPSRDDHAEETIPEQPPQQPPPQEQPSQKLEQMPPPSRPDEENSGQSAPPPGGDGGGDSARHRGYLPRETYRPQERLLRRGSGRRTRTRQAKQGRCRSRPSAACRDLALDATMRAAAPHQRRHRRGDSHVAVVIGQEELAGAVEAYRQLHSLRGGSASGSVGARRRMIASKGAVMSLSDAYQNVIKWP